MVRFGKVVRRNGGETPRQPDKGAEAVPEAERPPELRTADLFRARTILNRVRIDPHLPEVASPVRLAKGELCRHAAEVTLCLPQHDGMKYLDYGTLVITDSRMIFTGAAMTIKTALRDIVGLSIVGAGGLEVGSRSRRRQEIYATAFPVECLAYLIAAYRTQGKTPPISEELARELEIERQDP